VSDGGAPSGRSETPRGADAGGFAGVLSLVRAVLPETLIDGNGWERLAARVCGLPSPAADAAFGFEVRLAEQEASADLLLTVARDSRIADALVRKGASGDPGAASLARVLSEVARPGSPLAPAVDLVALEYDIVGVAGSPAPGVFLRSAAAEGYLDPGLLTAATAMAAGWAEDASERNAVARIAAALPPGGAIRWVGAFPDRRTRAVRLLVRGLGDGSAAFLDRIGRSDAAAAIDEAVSAFRACGLDNHVIALDVAQGRVLPSLGLELSRPGRIGSGWGAAFDMMVDKRWSLPEKAAALRRARRSESIFSSSGVSELHCSVHHIKLAFGNGAVTAKGYIACVLSPFPARERNS